MSRRFVLWLGTDERHVAVVTDQGVWLQSEYLDDDGEWSVFASWDIAGNERSLDWIDIRVLASLDPGRRGGRHA